MRLRLFHRLGGPLTPGEKARREHERWLSKALRSGQADEMRIPVRAVASGGFGGLVRTRLGKAWAERWWMDAIDRADNGV